MKDSKPYKQSRNRGIDRILLVHGRASCWVVFYHGNNFPWGEDTLKWYRLFLLLPSFFRVVLDPSLGRPHPCDFELFEVEGVANHGKRAESHGSSSNDGV